MISSSTRWITRDGFEAWRIVIVSAWGDYGKPRPAVVVEADAFNELESVVVALITSEQRESSRLFRKSIEPTERNGLRHPFDVMVDKLFSFPAVKIGESVGSLTVGERRGVTAALGTLLEFERFICDGFCRGSGVRWGRLN